jgi:hypothetical protein
VVRSDAISLSQAWTFPAAVRGALARFACRFEAPFWVPPGATVVKDGKRILRVSSLTLTETLVGTEAEDGYAYEGSFGGTPEVEQVRDFRGQLSIGPGPDDSTVSLGWRVSFRADRPDAVVTVARVLAEVTRAMTSALTDHFRPLPSTPAG